MSEFFMVLPDGMSEIGTLDEATSICDGLNKHVPATRFRVYRVKRWLYPARHFPKMVQLLKDIVDIGRITPALRDRATILLQTVAKRNETPHLERCVVPEFDPKARKA